MLSDFPKEDVLQSTDGSIKLHSVNIEVGSIIIIRNVA